jgi:hypothetical protein
MQINSILEIHQSVGSGITQGKEQNDKDPCYRFTYNKALVVWSSAKISA